MASSILTNAMKKLKAGKQLQVKEFSAVIKNIPSLSPRNKILLRKFLLKQNLHPKQQRSFIDIDPKFAVTAIKDIHPLVQNYFVKEYNRSRALLFKRLPEFSKVSGDIIPSVLRHPNTDEKLVGKILPKITKPVAMYAAIKKFPESLKYSPEPVEIPDELQKIVAKKDVKLLKYIPNVSKEVKIWVLKNKLNQVSENPPEPDDEVEHPVSIEEPAPKRRGRPPKVKLDSEEKTEEQPKRRGRPPKVKPDSEEKTEEQPKRRGRPPKVKVEEETKPEEQPKRRGRPPKVKEIPEVLDSKPKKVKIPEETSEPATPKRRGRPPKAQPSEKPSEVQEQPKRRGRPPKAKEETKPEEQQPKRRGRPPKIKVEVEEQQPKRRGRPPKVKEVPEPIKPIEKKIKIEEEKPEQPAPKRRGRPPKVKQEIEKSPGTKIEIPETPQEEEPKPAPKRRGRPPKAKTNPLSQESKEREAPKTNPLTIEQPDIEDEDEDDDIDITKISEISDEGIDHLNVPEEEQDESETSEEVDHLNVPEEEQEEKPKVNPHLQVSDEDEELPEDLENLPEEEPATTRRSAKRPVITEDELEEDEPTPSNKQTTNKKEQNEDVDDEIPEDLEGLEEIAPPKKTKKPVITEEELEEDEEPPTTGKGKSKGKESPQPASNNEDLDDDLPEDLEDLFANNRDDVFVDDYEEDSEEPAKKNVLLSPDEELEYVKLLKLAIKRMLSDSKFIQALESSIISKEQLHKYLIEGNLLEKYIKNKDLVSRFKSLTDAQKEEILDTAVPADTIEFTTQSSSEDSSVLDSIVKQVFSALKSKDLLGEIKAILANNGATIKDARVEREKTRNGVTTTYYFTFYLEDPDTLCYLYVDPENNDVSIQSHTTKIE